MTTENATQLPSSPPTPTTPPAPAPAVDPPALGAIITLADGRQLKVHQDCKDARDQFEVWARQTAMSKLDVMLKLREISPEEYALRRQETIKDFQKLQYAFGGSAFGEMANTGAGVVKQLHIRISLNHPDVKLSDVESWIESKGFLAANGIMNEADGYYPKSNSQADGQR